RYDFPLPGVPTSKVILRKLIGNILYTGKKQMSFIQNKYNEIYKYKKEGFIPENLNSLQKLKYISKYIEFNIDNNKLYYLNKECIPIEKSDFNLQEYYN